MKEMLELYIHIPFCVKKCNYCDFLSFPAPAELQQRYVNQLIQEIASTASLCGDYTVSSVFIGGGTPSLLEPQYIKAIMDTVRRSYGLLPEAEITIECNPGSTLRHKFSVYKKAGINRLSIGLQSADNGELKLLGRTHSFEEFLKCYQGARMEGFSNINVDLINCIPMQTLKTWKKTLRTVLMLKPEHVSVYNLIVEAGTPFADMQAEGLLMLPGEEEQAAIDAYSTQYLKQMGYERYEISNFAKPGYACRHNIGYWNGTPYLGFGISAASCFEGMRWSDTRSMETYLAADLTKEKGFSGIRTELHKLSEREQIEEFMFLGLRMVQGVSETGFLMRFKRRMESVYGELLERLCADGLMAKDGSRWYLTERGMDVGNAVMSEFLLDHEIV